VRTLGGTATLLAAGLVLAVAGAGCRAKDPTISAPFTDTFDRGELGASWNATSPQYKLAGGALTVQNAYNHPAWLKERLPRDAQIDLDVSSKSAVGDIKIELWGDGESFAHEKGAYTSSGYVFIFGGWRNSLSVLCRMEEHGAGRKAERADLKVQPNRTYHWTITRKGGSLDWKIDGQPFLAWNDPEPLAGQGHEYLGLNDWESQVTIDNLSIRPAP
jgi:hypothetical protein